METTRGFDVQKMRGLRNAAIAVAMFLFLMVPWRLSGGPGGPSKNLLAAHGAVFGVLVLLYAALLHRHQRANGELWAFGLMLVGLVVTATQMFFYGRLQESASILLVSFASGVVLRRRATLACFQGILLAVWVITAIRIGGIAQMLTWAFDLVLATLFAFSVQHLLNRGLTALIRRTERQRRLLMELRESTQNLRTLSGLIPICAHCKKIRNDDGYWEQVESFFRTHTDARFSHGVCPGCAREMMAGLDRT